MPVESADHSVERVNTTIEPGDTMFHGSEPYYFETGESALSAIKAALDNAGKHSDGVRSILDYASGYGRVLRWLQADFPKARLIAVDTDTRALASLKRNLEVETREADITTSRPLGETFDLIWSGSLVTHLPEAATARLLKYWKDHLAPGGVLVFSAHGELVVNRLRSGERLYGLRAEDAEHVVADYEASGYGYADYPKQTDYGISATSEAKLRAMASEASFKTVYFAPTGWIRHQDVIGLV